MGQSLFGLSYDEFVSLNPGIICNNIPTGTITCVERDSGMVASAIATVPCSQPFILRRGDTCDSVRQLSGSGEVATTNDLSWLDFYRYNPGINCNNLFPASIRLGFSDSVKVRQVGGMMSRLGLSLYGFLLCKVDGEGVFLAVHHYCCMPWHHVHNYLHPESMLCWWPSSPIRSVWWLQTHTPFHFTSLLKANTRPLRDFKLLIYSKRVI